MQEVISFQECNENWLAYGTNFAELDQEERMLKGAERTMLLALAAAPVIEGLFTGFETVPPKGGEGKFNLEGLPEGNVKGGQAKLGAGGGAEISR